MNLDRTVKILGQMRSRFQGQTVLVFAPGPSLPTLWDGRRSDLPKIAIGDAWKIVPEADILYHTDESWWAYHKGVPEFQGLKVSYGTTKRKDVIVVQGSGPEGYDERLGYVKHGSNSGCAAAHISAQLGAKRIVLVGFDMKQVNGKNHYFGEHPREIRRQLRYEMAISRFEKLGGELKKRGIQLLNATPGSAMKCFSTVSLDDVLGTEAVAA